MTTMPWNLQRARDTYAIEHWGDGYFNIGDQGHVIATPDRNNPAATVDLHQVAETVRREGMALPVLVRFTDILRDRV
ncbi:MAG: arginine decarboxylase, partial [Methylococcaceae bacterium]|nr:arginine decarboxylase [Methylococcaceae bacterium]